MACDTQLGEHTHNPNMLVGAGAANPGGRGLQSLDPKEREVSNRVGSILQQRQARRKSNAQSGQNQEMSMGKFQPDFTKDGQDPKDQSTYSRIKEKDEISRFQVALENNAMDQFYPPEPDENKNEDGDQKESLSQQMKKIVEQQQNQSKKKQSEEEADSDAQAPAYVPEGTVIKTKATLTIEQELTFPDGTTRTQTETFVSEGEELR